jgi:hypothetical protein
MENTSATAKISGIPGSIGRITPSMPINMIIKALTNNMISSQVIIY